MLSDEKGRKIDRYFSDYTLFDIETTGLSTSGDMLTEIGAVKVRGGKIVDEFDKLRGVRKVRLPVPDMEQVYEFEELVVQVDKSKFAVQKALDETQLLFDKLMQDYFG